MPPTSISATEREKKIKNINECFTELEAITSVTASSMSLRQAYVVAVLTANTSYEMRTNDGNGRVLTGRGIEPAINWRTSREVTGFTVTSYDEHYEAGDPVMSYSPLRSSLWVVLPYGSWHRYWDEERLKFAIEGTFGVFKDNGVFRKRVTDLYAPYLEFEKLLPQTKKVG